MPKNNAKSEIKSPVGNSSAIAHGRVRNFLDIAARRIISLGGIGVIATLLMLFVFLLYEVAPLFRAASIEQSNRFVIPLENEATTAHLALEEQGEIAFHLSSDGAINFIDLNAQQIVSSELLAIPPGRAITSIAKAEPESGMLALGLDNGGVIVFAHEYLTGFVGAENRREITPFITYPLGIEPVFLFEGQSIEQLALSGQEDGIVIAAISATGELRILQATRSRSLIATFDPNAVAPYTTRISTPLPLDLRVDQSFVDGDQRRLLLLSNGAVNSVDISVALDGRLNQESLNLSLPDAENSQSNLLLGGVSLLVSGSQGNVHQFLLLNQSEAEAQFPVRSFAGGGDDLAAIIPEQRQKNFISVDDAGWVRAFNTTSSREIFTVQVASEGFVSAAIAPRGDRLLVETERGEFSVWEIDNPHPDISWSALWNQVWYEGYSEPAYVWQSSATDNAFEPKYSLVPLSFGTLKAAFYAMLLAAPLAICGAIYTGYFMAPAMRRKVKPIIELMEALPTVVLGFLAGLWLAPFVELNLLGVFTVLIVLPVMILLASLAWHLLPKRIRLFVPEGWEAAILIPVVLFCGWFSFLIATPIELAFFAGDLRSWISNELGINYDQRNAMVVGFAMGFAVIPTIFSIAEDAIFTVPRHLPYGSLALGATPWQSLCYVVLPTASPGIFSALMIGLGRAVGETMIVLMATGNTPIMDANIFEGMRTLAANIAIEIPESEVDSTHYRILFLAALVLFAFTFMINTIAEVVRQRLRGRYTVL